MLKFSNDARHLTTAAVLFAVWAALPPPHVAAQTPPIWEQTLAEEAWAMSLTPFGHILLTTKSELSAVEPLSGKRVWTRTQVKNVVRVTGTRFMIVTTPQGEVIADQENGQDLWSYSSLGLSAIKGALHFEGAGVVLVHGVAPSGPHTVVAARYSTGEVLWRRSDFFKESAVAAKVKYRARLQDTETSVVLDTEDDGLLRLDLKTGDVVWRLPRVSVPTGGKPVGLNVAPGLILATTYEGGLFAIDASSGAVRWKRAKNFPTTVVQSRATKHGVLVQGLAFTASNGRVHWRPFLTMLDPESGSTRWTTDDSFEGRSYFLLEDDAVVVALKNGVATYDLMTGKTRSTFAMPEFQGGEVACCLERTPDGGLRVWSSQTMRTFTSDGRPVVSTYLKAPGASFLSQIAGAALIALGSMSGTPVDNTALGQPTRASTYARDYMYLFTEEPGGHKDRFALVRLNKSDGKESGRIHFAERSPDFRLDPATGIVVVADERRLYAVAFREP